MEGIGKLEKVALNMAEFAATMGIGRSKAFELSQHAGFPAVRLGRRIIIPIDALKAWLERQAANDDTI